MIICLCIKFESNTLIFSKDIEQKPFLLRMGRTYVRTAVILWEHKNIVYYEALLNNPLMKSSADLSLKCALITVITLSIGKDRPEQTV